MDVRDMVRTLEDVARRFNLKHGYVVYPYVSRGFNIVGYSEGVIGRLRPLRGNRGFYVLNIDMPRLDGKVRNAHVDLALLLFKNDLSKLKSAAKNLAVYDYSFEIVTVLSYSVERRDVEIAPTYKPVLTYSCSGGVTRRDYLEDVYQNCGLGLRQPFQYFKHPDRPLVSFIEIGGWTV